MACQTLSFSRRTRCDSKDMGGSMATKESKLHDVVLDDVAQRSGFFVEGPAAFDAEGLGGGDLDVVDVVAVPDRLEDAVGEAEDEDVLDGLFAEVVVDAEDLALGEDGVDLAVELLGGFEVVAEGLFDDRADCALSGLGEALRAEVVDDFGEVLRGDGEIEEAVAADAVLFGDLVELGLEACRRPRRRRSSSRSSGPS